MVRRLATIRQISEIRPILNADQLELAIIDGWQAVVRKGEFVPGQTIVYCEIDSFLPIEPQYEFLRKNCYRKMADGTEGFRIRTMKLRGELSQGLVLPWDLEEDIGVLEYGTDVTELLGITKYDPMIGRVGIGDDIKCSFPSFIPKTDEERIQNLTRMIPGLLQQRWTVTEKLDGTSFTCYWHEGEFGVCSRNYQVEGGVWLDVANQYQLDKYTYGGSLAIQGEIVGEGIQGNKYQLNGKQLFVFNIWDIDKQEYLEQSEAMKVADEFGLQYVPTICHNFTLPGTIQEILTLAEDKSKLNPATEREGLVFVSDEGNRISFKAISNKFLLKEKD